MDMNLYLKFSVFMGSMAVGLGLTMLAIVKLSSKRFDRREQQLREQSRKTSNDPS